jgi:hypothetical protein
VTKTKNKTTGNIKIAENAARKIVPILEECGVRHFGKP